MDKDKLIQDINEWLDDNESAASAHILVRATIYGVYEGFPNDCYEQGEAWNDEERRKLLNEMDVLALADLYDELIDMDD